DRWRSGAGLAYPGRLGSFRRPIRLAPMTHAKVSSAAGGRSDGGAPLEGAPPMERVRPRVPPGAVGIVLGAAALAAVCVGWRWWWSPRPPPVRAGGAAAERGRAYLRYGRPDLAFRAVEDIRDEEPGAAEAVAVAAQALLRLGQYRVARPALERLLK